VFVPRSVAFTEPQLREAIAASVSLADAIRRIGLRPSGGNHVTVRRYAERWRIPIEHLRIGGTYPRGGRKPTPLEEVLVRGSTYHRAGLKRRLYETSLKTPLCELCGQSEEWRGSRMALILDHVNGDATDNRLANLRIVCPNCNATLATHCGRNKPRGRPAIPCLQCGDSFRPRKQDQRFCSQACSSAHTGRLSRRADRPPLEVLLSLVAAEGYEAVGRHFGVSGNAIRKWLRRYGVTPPPGTGRDSHPPPVPPPVLTDAEASRALDLLAGGASVYSVVKIIGVSKSTITDLKRGQTYRHLDRPPELRDAA
jgi:transposase